MQLEIIENCAYKLFQVDFLSTLSGELLISMLVSQATRRKLEK